jgi:cation diffusion facilitator family transporter
MNLERNAAALANRDDDRERVIVRTSIVGIAANVVLAAFKAVVGLAANSIAVVLDAVNNLSDALSSVITIVGTKLAGKAPDKKHPYGYGRIEYMSQFLVAVLVLYAGVTALVESVKKIIRPEAADYSTLSLVIIAAAVVVKLLLGAYVKRKGRAVNSGSLIASGSDASFDAILSLSVLASAVVFLIWHVSLEAYVGVVIAGFIIKSGIELIREALDEILGRRADGDFSAEIKAIAAAHPEVLGVYDLYLNNYGPDRYTGSLHVEVRDTMTAAELDRLTREISAEVYRQTKVVLVAVGVYSANLGDDAAATMRETVRDLVAAHPEVLQMHGFYVDEAAKAMTFDVVLDFAVPDHAAAVEAIRAEVAAAFPDYALHVTPDLDISD